MIDREFLSSLVAEARLAPSVHNVQPTRWSLRDTHTIMLLDDPTRRLPAADPHNRDIGISHGAALEGMAIALAAKGLRAVVVPAHGGEHGRFRALAALQVQPGEVSTLFSQVVAKRATWRGRFATASLEQLAALRAAQDDLVLVDERAAINRISVLADQASLFFLRDEHHRRELREWMRLSPRHPNWARDGLNATAMALNGAEAFAAGLLLGPLFRPLDRVGAAGPLLSERAKTKSASAIGLFHRPRGEDPMESGRAYYRCWLAAEAAGLVGCPMSVLADHVPTNLKLSLEHGIAPDRQLIGVFRFGAAQRGRRVCHYRLPISELVV
jgi:nitroreductase